MAAKMTAGRLRHRVQWSKPVRTRKQGGQAVTDYEPVKPSYAAVEPAGGREVQTHDQAVLVRTHVVTVRHEPSWLPVQKDWLCVWNGLTLNVLDVEYDLTDANNSWAICSCVEQAPATTT